MDIHVQISSCTESIFSELIANCASFRSN